MPSPSIFIQACLFLWASFAPWVSSTPVRRIVECPGYKASNVTRTANGITANLALAGTACNIYGQDLTDLKFLVEYQTDSRVHVMIYDRDEQVYQVPDFVVPRPTGSISASSSLLDVTLEEEPFSFTITRKANNETIFTTRNSSIIFESQYLQIRTSLPNNPSLYGLGEHTDSLRLPTSNYIRTLWARDAGAVPQNTNLYGTHPVYFEQRAGSGNTHGVLLLNSNGMDIKINNDDGQYLEYNVIGGVMDFYFLAGPGPFDVARAYSEITQKAVMMPYWGFGFHQCRFGYESVDEVAAVVANYSAANIPLETMWTDIDYMDEYKVFTLGKNFPLDRMRNLVNDLHSNDQHYIVMVDPAVAYQDYDAFNNGVKADVFLKKNDNSIYKGQVWPGVTAFPDWFHENTQTYWDNEFASFFSADNGVDIDALWIDMNEPSNFCDYPCSDLNPATLEEGIVSAKPGVLLRRSADSHRQVIEGKRIFRRQNATGLKTGLAGRNLLDPLYKINNAAGVLSNKTANTDIVHKGGWAEYDTHNLYGTMMSRTSQNSMLQRRPTKRAMVITRSTFVGAGAYVGHWLGDNVSAWDQYITSIRHLLQFVSFFQVPMAGADVCGFLNDATENLCARWTTLGAFYPFYRNHNVAGAKPQEAYRWESVAAAARKAIDLRYRLLDYIYTAMHLQSVDGTPMLSPIWFHYPSDTATHAIQSQFFYGPSLLISPVTDEDSTSVTFYLPNDVYYDLFTLKRVANTGASVTYSDIAFTDIPVFIKGGSIIPTRISSANTTTALRNENFELIIAPGADGTASGRLYLDDGESVEQQGTSDITFMYDGGTIKMHGVCAYATNVSVVSVTVLGEGNATKFQISEDLNGPWSHDLKTMRGAGL